LIFTARIGVPSKDGTRVAVGDGVAVAGTVVAVAVNVGGTGVAEADGGIVDVAGTVVAVDVG
jgi:hypothetical protein